MQPCSATVRSLEDVASRADLPFHHGASNSCHLHSVHTAITLLGTYPAGADCTLSSLSNASDLKLLKYLEEVKHVYMRISIYIYIVYMIVCRCIDAYLAAISLANPVSPPPKEWMGSTHQPPHAVHSWDIYIYTFDLDGWIDRYRHIVTQYIYIHIYRYI